jgi:hypothetical protein
MSKQTAVEWLGHEINKIYTEVPDQLFYDIALLLQKAKEMEREQIRIAYMEGAFEKMRHLDGKEFMMPTEYYNETFKSE